MNIKPKLFAIAVSLGAMVATAGTGSGIELTVAGYRGSETLKDFPLPLRLGAGAPGSVTTAPSPSIVITDDKGNLLPVEVETWNPNGESLVWVRVPELKNGAKLFVKESQDSAVQPSTSNLQPVSNPDVWHGYAGVWHFAEALGEAKDSAAGRAAVPTGDAGTNAMVSVAGLAGRARVLAAGRSASYFTVRDSETMKVAPTFTFSGWFKGDGVNPFKLVRLVSRSADKWGWSGGGGWGIALNGLENLQIDGSKNRVFANVPSFGDNDWHHLSVTYDRTNVTVFADGGFCAIQRGRIEPAGDPAAPLKFGWRVTVPSNPITFRGAVDEFRLKLGTVSADWAQAECDAFANPDFVVAKGAKTASVNAPVGSARRADRDDLLPVIPRVASWRPAGGSVMVGREVKGIGAEAQGVANILAGDMALGGEGGTNESSTTNLQPKSHRICLTIDSAISANPEAYRLTIAPSGVAIVGASRTGLFWGTRTLLQLLDAAPDRKTIACGVIDDAPKYRRRGFMLDVARKYFPLAYLKDLAKVMAYYKMNDFHLHLNDNGGKELGDDWKDIYAAFRMECETYPGLTAKDGSYGKAEFRQFIKDAAKIGVQVVPEFDAPAHSLAFTRYRPDFAKKDCDPAHIELKNPDVIPFFEKLWAEYLGGDDPVFAGPVVHVGSDEYWAKEAEYFRVFLDRMLGVVQSYGKTPRAWGSLQHCAGKTPVRSKGVELDIWYNPYYGPGAAIAAGYEIISIEDNLLYICPACGYYNDYLNLPLIYRYWEPNYIGSDEVDPAHPQLLGGAFAVWNDHIGNGVSCDDVTDRVFPALQVMAEKTWHGTDRSLSYEDFAKRAGRMSEAPGVNLRDRVAADAQGNVDLGSAKAIGWTQQGGWTVSFDLTVDGKESKDTVLFDDGISQVCLNLGGTGRFGFRRDGYDCAFRDPLPAGKLAVTMTGDAKGTTLYLGGKLVERLQKPMRVVTKKNYKIARVETLHFPFVRASGAARVANFKVQLGVKE